MQLSARNKKKVMKKMPGSTTKLTYKHKKHSPHKCGVCKKPLHGKPSARASQIRKLSKSQRTPTRPFGGMLCTICTRKVIALKAKLKQDLITKTDVPISLKQYVGVQ